jgi:TolA-binding protein
MPVEEKDIQELKKEVVETRNLVIKTDNLLKNLHSELKRVAEKQTAFERRAIASTATAYILFGALAALGAYTYAKVKIQEREGELVTARDELRKSDEALKAARAAEGESKAESAKALELFERLASGDESKRSVAVEEIAAMQPRRLTALELLALKDKAASLREAAANRALEEGRGAFARRDFRAADEDLSRHLVLAAKPDEYAYFLLGQARHSLRDFKGAVEPLQTYLKAVPNAKSADYLTLILAESLAEAGERQRAIEVYRAGAERYPASQFATSMRSRARRLNENPDRAREAARPAQR